ncbi:MAG: CbrC family protein [Comamonadaceae bacterium]|nr:MAG: CbrC family protein [Comamonadaceae bacterium]
MNDAKEPNERGTALRPASELPSFRYHPDPVRSRVIVASPDTVCPACDKVTGWAYATQPYGLGEQPDNLCPWCIADGTAAERFGSEFVGDTSGAVAPAVWAELNARTPGYLSWQGERWQVCCDDAAIFLGPVGWKELQAFPEAVASAVAQGWREESLQHATSDGNLTAYLFRCSHCGKHLAHADAS